VLGLGLVAFRDPHGIRPLVLGKREPAAATNTSWPPNRWRWTSSASSGARRAPGEGIVITARGELFAQQCARAAARALHLRVRVFRAPGLDDREHLGAQGAHAHGREARREDPALRPDHDIDVVIPIPDTSRDSALESPTCWA
jgi:amidophosphoribosyltransferase